MSMVGDFVRSLRTDELIELREGLDLRWYWNLHNNNTGGVAVHYRSLVQETLRQREVTDELA